MKQIEKNGEVLDNLLMKLIKLAYEVSITKSNN